MPDVRTHLVAADRDEVRRAVEEVLSRPEYADLQERGLQAWLTELRRRAAEWLAQLLGQEGTAVVAWALLVVAAALVLLLAIRWARRLEADPGGGDPVLDGPVRRPEEWVAEAEAHRRAGDRRAAVRAAFRAVVAGHAEAGTVEEIPGTTVGEYRRQVADNHPSAATSFDAAARTFESVWYGDRRPTDDDVDRVLAVARRSLPAGARR